MNERKKNVPSVRRVDLKRVNNEIPEMPPFPFMVDSNWHQEYVLDNPDAGHFDVLRRDPRGFGSRKDETEDASSDGSQSP